jgi:P4 family phage/plasmid primase-like protien
VSAAEKVWGTMTDEEFLAAVADEAEEKKAREAAGEKTDEEDPDPVYPIPQRPRRKRASSPMPETNCTQTANAERYAFTFAGCLRYLSDRGVWQRWDSRRWAAGTSGDLLRAGKIIAQQILQEAYDAPDEDKRKGLAAWSLKSHGLGEINAMIKLATAESEMESNSKDFDQQPHLLNCWNGTVDLQDGTLRPHDRKDFITKLVPIAYNASATCPRWLQFLDEVFAGDKDLIAFVQRAVGYSVTGHTREHAFFIPYGNGFNGKSVFMRQVMALAGDAARTTSFTTFTADRNKQAANTPELAELVGMRIVASSEPDDGVRLSESVIKSLTGDDEIQVCKKYESPFTFTPHFKLWLPTNYKPEIRGVDNGIWRRPRLIPFTVSFEGKAGRPARQARLVVLTPVVGGAGPGADPPKCRHRLPGRNPRARRDCAASLLRAATARSSLAARRLTAGTSAITDKMRARRFVRDSPSSTHSCWWDSRGCRSPTCRRRSGSSGSRR